jgi:hypothetical protein
LIRNVQSVAGVTVAAAVELKLYSLPRLEPYKLPRTAGAAVSIVSGASGTIWYRRPTHVYVAFN